ncbi:MAG: helix-turn-helix transcriptional regulator [Alphaproteobacteria bacterium]|nr:helix-turn-helix transcriptional regulator [Alphaproteobacteria bacterium]MBV9692732.1 helix-turn-helix transcriptional regulator [Alphaproteobacteria bacterium]
MDIRKHVGRNVRRLRLGRRISQEVLALESDIDRTYMSGIERGISNPSVVLLSRLAKVLRVTVADLVTPSAEKEPAPKNLPRGRNVSQRGRKTKSRRK